MKMIPVTKKHIAEGEAESCESCPVALAIRGDFPLAQVHRDTTLTGDGGVLRHGDEVRWWIDDFDEWAEDGDPVDNSVPVTLVMLTGLRGRPERLLTLSEWQEGCRG